ncbi:MAG TPA: tetratricopeptide repeat protein [Anaeromyxobacteraceae bacterium]|nr:tetratricopeptide repeat protein [Anaeromyxobacteraceae bacterium]
MSRAGARWLPFAAILALAVACYANALQASFQFDDYLHIVDDPAVRRLGPALAAAWRSNRGVAALTFALDYACHGLSAPGYHLVNLVIHALNGFLIFALGARLLSRSGPEGGAASRGGALAGALLFVSHPVQTEAVTYVVQRQASLATLFYLLALRLYAEARHLPRGRLARLSWLGALASALLAMRTKEIAFTLPLALCLYEWVYGAGRPARRLALLAPFLATLAVIPLTILHGQDATAGGVLRVADAASRVQSALPRWLYFATEARVMVTYLRLLLLPVGQNLDYDYPLQASFLSPAVMLSALLLAGLAALALWCLRRAGQPGQEPLRAVGFGVIFFLLASTVESSVVPIVDVIMEHRLYLPGAGIFLAAGALSMVAWERLPHSPQWPRRTAVTGLAAAVATLSLATYARNEVWRDGVSLWRDAAAKSPRKARPHLMLGEALKDQGDLPAAVREWQLAVALDPRDSNALNQLGAAALLAGNVSGARAYLDRAVAADGRNAQAHYNLALALERTGDLVRAGAEYQRFLNTARPALLSTLPVLPPAPGP